jgi:hypothetical protein
VELLKQIAPATTRVALLFNPAGPPLEFFLPSVEAAASSLNVDANLVTIHKRDEIEGVIAAQARDPGGGRNPCWPFKTRDYSVSSKTRAVSSNWRVNTNRNSWPACPRSIFGGE